MERTHPQPAEPPDPADHPMSVVEQPATVDTCRQDYLDGTAAREAAESRWSR